MVENVVSEAIFLSELSNINLDDMWFEQNGAIYYVANEMVYLLNNKFNVRVILRNGDIK